MNYIFVIKAADVVSLSSDNPLKRKNDGECRCMRFFFLISVLIIELIILFRKFYKQDVSIYILLETFISCSYDINN